MTNDHAFMGAVELGKKIARGAVSSVDATRVMLERIERLNGSLKCYELVMAAGDGRQEGHREIKARKSGDCQACLGHQGPLRYRGRTDGVRIPITGRPSPKDLHRGSPAWRPAR
jgi:hypothetical protein